MTSQPASTSAFAASASRPACSHSPVKMTRNLASGLVWRAPIRNAFTLSRTVPNGMPATKPSVFVVVLSPAATPFT